MRRQSEFLSQKGEEDGYTMGVGETCSKIFIFIKFRGGRT